MGADIMGRKQTKVLSSNQGYGYDWSFVVEWISRRFDEEELNPSRSVMSEPVGVAIDQNLNTTSVHEQVRKSWRVLQKRWVAGWESLDAGSLPSSDAYFESLVNDTNQWIEDHFPSIGAGSSVERRRLLAAVRQQRLREKRKSSSSKSAIQVSISGDLYKQLWKHWQIPESKRHDVVRAGLQMILESPELLAKAKQLAGVTA